MGGEVIQISLHSPYRASSPDTSHAQLGCSEKGAVRREQPVKAAGIPDSTTWALQQQKHLCIHPRGRVGWHQSMPWPY